MSDNLVGALLREIIRVAEKRQRWKGYARTNGFAKSYAPALAMMTEGIEDAVRAIERQDASAAAVAFKNLQGFNSDD